MASERILDKTMEFNKFLTYKYILLKITNYTFMNLSEKKIYGYTGLSLLRKIIRVGFTFQWRQTQIESYRKLKVIENLDKRKIKKKI